MLIKDWMLKPEHGETNESHPWKISDHELAAHRDKVCERAMKKSRAVLLHISASSSHNVERKNDSWLPLICLV